MADAQQTEVFDVVVVGGGPAGENAAQYAVQGTDRTAAIVEDELLGGECSYYACIPSKALLRPVDVADTAAHLSGLTGAPSIDRDALLARRDYWVSDYDDTGQVRWAEGAGIAVIRGRGRLTGERQVTVTGSAGDRVLRAREAVVLATGSVAAIPEPWRAVHPWTSRDVTGVRDVPDSLAVVGGGVVACEAAFWMAALGSRVTLLAREGLLARVEPWAGELVADGLRGAGVDVRLGVRAAGSRAQVDRTAKLGRLHGGPVVIETGAEELTVAEVLVATGRRPAVADVGLESVGLAAGDLDGRTHGGQLPEWLYAVGDVSGDAPLTHWGKYQARQVGALIAARAQGQPEPEPPPVVPVPQVVFTSPQVAAVGETVAAARAAGRRVRVLEAAYSSASGASLLRDDVVGRAQLVVDEATDTLVGATFVGPEVAELVHPATVAIVGQVGVATLRHAVPSYPTASEIWLRLLEQ